MRRSSFNKEKDLLKYLAAKNGYKPNFIDNLIRKKLKKIKEQSQQVNQQTENQQKPLYMCLSYNKKFNRAVRKTFHKNYYKISYKTRNNVLDIITRKTKSTIEYTNDNYEKSGMYKIKCSECDMFYIGETGRNLKPGTKNTFKHSIKKTTTSIYTYLTTKYDHLFAVQ
jgi:hypothetical protein